MQDILIIAGVIALALAPVLFILIYVITKDKYDKEPLPYLIAAFMAGAFSAYPVIKTAEFLQYYPDKLLFALGLQAEAISSTETPLHLFIYTLLVIAFTEEIWKYLTTMIFYPLKPFNEPLDGIIYCVSVSMGFAAVENFIYVYQSGFATGILRMFTAVPSHAVFGTVIGYFIGKAKFIPERGKRSWLHIQGFLIALGLHTLYDYFIFLDWGVSGLISIGILIGGVVFARDAVRIRQENSPFRPAPIAVMIEAEEPLEEDITPEKQENKEENQP